MKMKLRPQRYPEFARLITTKEMCNSKMKKSRPYVAIVPLLLLLGFVFISLLGIFEVEWTVLLYEGSLTWLCTRTGQ